MDSIHWVRVWDPLVRIVHWSLVIAFFVAYVSGEENHELHEFMGYTVAVLVLVRIVWGFVGPEHARFADFVRSPKAVIANLIEIARMHPPRYLGHNPAGGAMVILLLVMLSATTATGILAEESGEKSADAVRMLPAALASENNDGNRHEARGPESEHEEKEGQLAELHETLGNLTLALVFLHIAGVLLGSLVHRENLVAAMITGRKRR